MLLPTFPILLLVTAVASIVMYNKTTQEIFGVLAVATAIVCLIWGVVIAHWSVNLLALIMVLRLRMPIVRLVESKIKL